MAEPQIVPVSVAASELCLTDQAVRARMKLGRLTRVALLDGRVGVLRAELDAALAEPPSPHRGPRGPRRLPPVLEENTAA